MHLVTVRFDRVFDVVPGARARKPVTWFGFEFADKRYFAVGVPGTVDIKEGATVTAALAKPGDWQTLVGWVDHATGDIVIESAAQETFSIAFCCVVGAACLAAYRLEPLGLGLALAGLAVWAVVSVVSLHRVNLAKAALRRVQAVIKGGA